MIWVSFAVLIGTLMASLALLRSSRGDALGIPLVAIGSFSFLYVIQPIQLIVTGGSEIFLTQWQFAHALLVPAVMMAFFMWGWLRPVRQRLEAVAPWDSEDMWKVGFGAACIGLILYLAFLELSGGVTHSFSQAHGAAMDFSDNTAYLYDGPWLMLSGSAMMIFGNARSSSRKRWRALAPYAFLLIYFSTAILTASRGPLFAVATTYFVGQSIAQRKKVSFGEAARMLLPVSVAVLLLVGYRNVLHLGPEASSHVASAETAYNEVAGVSEYDKEHDTASQEFLYHAAMLETVDETGKLDYGLNWLEFFFINPIPRVLWHDKPKPDYFGVTWGDIDENMGLDIVTGAAPGIVADMYARFHILSALFFLALGWSLRRLFISARNLGSPLAAVGYVMVYAVSLNMFAQGFGACFVPLGYSMVPVVLFAWASRRRARARRNEIIVRQALALRGGPWSS